MPRLTMAEVKIRTRDKSFLLEFWYLVFHKTHKSSIVPRSFRKASVDLSSRQDASGRRVIDDIMRSTIDLASAKLSMG